MGRWALPLFLLSVFVLLYLNLFRLPWTPIFRGGDESIFLLNAARMLDGQTIYRDFFELTAPGMTLFNLGLFKVFGPRAWISAASLVALGLGLTWLIVAISRKVLSGGITFLPAALFLSCAFVFVLDDTHHWYGTLAELGAVRTIIEKRTRTRLLGAGALCGLASFFTQTQGAFALLGLAIFLWWERRRVGRSWLELFRRVRYLFLSFVATVLATNAYFVWKAGLDRFLYCTVTFVWKYYPADRESNSVYAPLYEFTNAAHWRELSYLGVFLFIHILLPLVYVWFWMRYRREALAREQETRLMLLNITGLLVFAGVVPAPTTYRVCSIAPLGLILWVWLIQESRKFSRVLAIALWIVISCVAIALPFRIQSHWMRPLDLPRGRMALGELYYDRLLWWSQHTSPGQFVFAAAGTEILFPLALRNPAEVPFVKNNDYTRPEQVSEIAAALERNRVQFVLWESGLDPQSNHSSMNARLRPLRGYLRSCYRFVKILLGGDYRVENNHLGPLRNYLTRHYHLFRLTSDSSQVWERDN